MALRRVFVDDITGSVAAVSGPAAHHLARVARLNPGERVEISDQRRAYAAVIEACSPREVRFKVREPLPPPLPPFLDVSLAIVRFPRFEWAVEKLAELGVRSVTPMNAARCDRRLVTAAPKRLGRWRRIAFEAAQQSRQLAAPAVKEPVEFGTAVRNCGTRDRILADRDGNPLSLARGRGSAALLVGPEGGWTRKESQLAASRGFRRVGLGASVLRSETAVVAMAAVIASQRDARGEEPAS